MYSQIISLSIRLGKMDQALGIYRRSILPKIEERQGFAKNLVFSCRVRNELISCTVWETYASMMETERSGFMNQQIVKLSRVLAEPAEGDQYELEMFS
jgi:hypothetical protein